MPDRPPSIAEIAALTARLRALSDAGRAADLAEVERFLADKHELLDRITAHNAGPGATRDEHPDRDPYDGYRTYTPATAGKQLIAAGVPPDAAQDAVEGYLEALSTARGSEPAQGWEIDDDDVAATMLSRHTSGAGRPDPHPTSRPALVTGVAGEEDDQRAQLNRRDVDDTTDSDTAGRPDEDAAADGVPW